jgi:predicted HAD superfamily Cof-like phosphohydrolase
MSVLDLMTPEQREKSKESMAMTLCQQVRFPMGDHPQRLTGHFHQVVGIPVNTVPMIPSVSTRLRRGMLLLEEVLETFSAMGLELVVDGLRMSQGHESLTLEHIEGSRYDVVETADGLSDINVIVAGTAVEFGIPLHVTDYEVYSSNLTKVLPDGTTLVNGVTEGYREGEPGFQANRPVGKILKPDNFVPANIPAALVAFEKQEF